MFRGVALALGLLVLLPVLGIAGWIASHRTDLPAPPEDGELAVERPRIADDANGFVHVVRADLVSTVTADEVERLRGALARWQPDDAWVGQMLGENRAALLELERVIAAPETVYPDAVTAAHTDALNPLLQLPNLVRLANLESRRLRAKGERVAGFERSLLGLRLGAALLRARNPQLISSMTALALQNHALRELESLRAPAESWRRTWAGEYSFVKETVLAMDEAPEPDERGTGVLAVLPASFTWQPNRSLALFGARYRDIQRAFAGPCARGRRAFAAKDRGALLSEMARGNGVGVLLASVNVPRFERFNFRRCHTEARLALLQVQLALAAHGKRPDSLDELVPRYLDRVPADPFDGAPLRFDRERGLVYSVGSDFEPTGSLGPPSPDDELEPAFSEARAAAPSAARRP